MSPFEEYWLLEVQVLHGRALGTLPQEIEDKILEDMDRLWYAMIDTERVATNARSADVPATQTQLGIVDTGPDEWPHRRAA